MTMQCLQAKLSHILDSVLFSYRYMPSVQISRHGLIHGPASLLASSFVQSPDTSTSLLFLLGTIARFVSQMRKCVFSDIFHTNQSIGSSQLCAFTGRVPSRSAAFTML